MEDRSKHITSKRKHRKENFKRAWGNFWNLYVYYLDYGNNFMGIYVCTHI